MGRVTILPPQISPEKGKNKRNSKQNSNADTARWTFPAELESEITTLAAICHAEQQQRIPLPAGREEDIYDDSSDEDGDDDRTDVAVSMKENKTASMKMFFLDKMAEILCYKKHADFVTCTALLEEEDRVTVLAARNARWENKDIEILKEIAGFMEGVALQNTQGQGWVDGQLVDRLSTYYAPRLKYHANELLKLIRKEDFDKQTALIKAFLAGEVSPAEFVQVIYTICFSRNFFEKLKRLFPKPEELKKRTRQLGYLCRPSYAYMAFILAAREISGFQQVKIELLSGFKPRSVHSQNSGHRKWKKNVQVTYNVLVKKKKWVHAEMRMLLHLISTDTAARAFPYLGISKKTCLLCGHVLKNSGRFHARNNHGKIYAQWTLPSSLVVPAAYKSQLEDTVKSICDVLHREAEGDHEKINPIRESTISTPVAPRVDVWSPFNRSIPDAKTEAREEEWLAMYSRFGYSMLSEIVADSTNRSKSKTDGDRSEQENKVDIPVSKRCAQCGIDESLSPCSSCHSVYYCSSECRSTNWPRHKYRCSLGRPLDEADDFFMACKEEQFPDDDVAKAFGLLYFVTGFERQRLFRLYCELVNRWGITEDELRKAWKSNSLKQCITFRGSQVPSPRTREEVHWLAQYDTFAANVVGDFGILAETHKCWLSPEDRKRPWQELQPREKLEAYTLLWQLLSGFVPDAEEDNWIYFGFCTARDAVEATKLAKLYTALIHKSGFDKFWMAAANSAIVSLFRKYRLGREVRKLRNFETLMGEIRKWYQSVWQLKQFIRTSQQHLMRGAYVDYGFHNCKTPGERINLRNVYTRFFEKGGDEMALHRACIEGRLESFLTDKLGELHIPSRLLSNQYPLDRWPSGMVLGNAIWCCESMYEETRKWKEETGQEGVILTFPDEDTDEFEAGLEARASFLKQPMTRQIVESEGRDTWMVSGK